MVTNWSAGGAAQRPWRHQEGPVTCECDVMCDVLHTLASTKAWPMVVITTKVGGDVIVQQDVKQAHRRRSFCRSQRLGTLSRDHMQCDAIIETLAYRGCLGHPLRGTQSGRSPRPVHGNIMCDVM